MSGLGDCDRVRSRNNLNVGDMSLELAKVDLLFKPVMFQ